MNNIILIGFMGVGKSLTARELGRTLNREIISTDSLIEKVEDRKISIIFQDSGEAYFRAVEERIVKEVSERKNMIIDCGGGVALSQRNMQYLKEGGTVFYLAASPEVIYENIKHTKNRPLLAVDNPKETICALLTIRKPFYEKADVIIDMNHRDIQKACEGIILRIKDLLL